MAVRSMRFLWMPVLLLAGCLQTVPDTPAQTSAGGSNSTGQTANSGGGTTSGVIGGTSSGGSATTGGVSGGCTYPSQSAGGTVFPYFSVGVGWFSTNAVVDTSAPLGGFPTALLQLHCSGQRYALVNLSAAWDTHSAELAQSLNQYTTAWLSQGGLILTILEQGPSNGAPASQMDLTNWATMNATNYSLVNDPTEAALTNLGIVAWPAMYIVRLSDMVIVNSTLGATSSFLGTYAELLAQ